jgi:hypothetical protein
MKVYQVECRAIVTLAAQDMEKAALHGASVIKDNLHLIHVKAVHERNFEATTWKDRTPNSEKDFVVAMQSLQLAG